MNHTLTFSHSEKTDKKNHPAIITVWIHGTRFYPAELFFLNLMCKNFAYYTKPGINNTLTFKSNYVIRQTAEFLSHALPTDFRLEDFYFYGWSGKLSFEARTEAAQNLYTSLIELIHSYKKEYGFIPKIRIITHSHGGNVALNLAQCNQDNNLEIEELILMACPVQDQTSYLIHNPLFKTIYSLYSKSDLIQVLDPQRVYSWFQKKTPHPQDPHEPLIFSDRIFPYDDKMCQVQLKFGQRDVMHIEFIMLKFIKHLPHILTYIKQLSPEEFHKNNLIILKKG